MRSAISPNDGRVAYLVRLLDRDGVPVAATWREVAVGSERLGLSRPSYGHVRRLVRIERRRRELRRHAAAVLGEAGATLFAGLVPSVPALADKLDELRLEEELVLQEHKAFGAAQLRRSSG
ncbi:MAG TPA: hypothetical protein VNP93_05970 [Gaiellaceae bacterium]|nr:hypothetical protein [Gaiellaceae bacterium]